MATRPIDNYWAILTGQYIPLPATALSQIIHFEITSRAGLVAVTTTLIPVGTVYMFIDSGGSDENFVVVRLDSGPSNVANSSDITPVDYSLATNNKHWRVVGGYLA